MTRQMLIDASQPEETRVVVTQNNRVDDFDYDIDAKKQLKGNIYLAKVTRVEPSLQAAFVDYGGNRHGFLAFNEIHPDYYKIPIADREKLIEEETESLQGDDVEDGESVETVGGDDWEDEEKRRRKLRRRYKIQEVIKRGQIILIQVVKEERGNKGAALTTYLSLPGRYCVLMPNTARGGGISRKITNQKDRKRLKTMLDDLNIPGGMTVIVRTAGSERTKVEIKRDYTYLSRLWDTIREETLKSIAPALIYEEANLIKRAIRDLYSKEIEAVLVDGDEGYKVAKDMMKTLMPSHAKKVQPYKDGGVPLFHKMQIEGQLDGINSPEVQLRSGGYIVMHQTEALVAIDVNSGRATRERHIEETALRTNLEAAEEVARQLRLRDMAGLIVIDFIDMDEHRNNHAVERKLKEALKADRARIQVGRISHFGLLEMSRQRLRPSLTEISSEVCPHCGGTGLIRSTEWAALATLRAIEEEAIKNENKQLTVLVRPETALYILNHKRTALAAIEERYGISVTINADADIAGETCLFVSPDGEARRAVARPLEKSDDGAQDGDGRKRKRSRRRRRGRNDETRDADSTEENDETEAQADSSDENAGETTGDDEGEPSRKRRRRGRRGGRRRNRRAEAEVNEESETASDSDTADENTVNAESDESAGEPAAPEASDDETNDEAASDDEAPKKRSRSRTRSTRRPRRKASEAAATDDTAEEQGSSDEPSRGEEKTADQNATGSDIETAPAEPEETEPEAKAEPKPQPDSSDQSDSDDSVSDVNVDVTTQPDGPKRTGWWNRVLG